MQDYLLNTQSDSISEDNLQSTEVFENTDVVENEFDNSADSFDGQQNTDIQSYDSGNVINVDNDFGGNIKGAIASANPGDIVQLGGRVYYTEGIVVDKDITIDGQEGTVLDGSGTSGTVVTFNSEADGATIQDLEITNANNGLYANAAENLTIQGLEITDIGLNGTLRYGENNTGIMLNNANGATVSDIDVKDIGRKGIGIGDTDGAEISNVNVQNVNLAAEHAQSHDTSGIKLYNTNDIVVKDSYFSDINAIHLWNDSTNGTKIENNVVENVGEDFIAPGFNQNVQIAGIYNEKSSNATVKYNRGTSIDDTLVFKATEFSTETMDYSDNDFQTFELGTQDYWVNEEAEKLIATTADPNAANFGSISNDYYGQANIG